MISGEDLHGSACTQARYTGVSDERAGKMGGSFGGAERDRTAGLLVANEALSQLSYSPTTPLVYQ